MFSRKLINISAIAVSLWVWAPAASSGSLSQLEGKAAYQPVQNISYEFGSKSMSGYFLLVHSWYDENCCQEKDCHPVPCEQIEKLKRGLAVARCGDQAKPLVSKGPPEGIAR